MSDENGFLLESLPEHVTATMEVRDRFLNALGGGSAFGLEFLVDDFQKWKPGQTVKVAFLGGSDALCRQIAEATKPITDSCNIKLDFGENGSVRRWSEQDTQFSADIRVSFDKKGYFSLVGTDSINATIGDASERVGGRPYQCSLNLGGYAVGLPNRWRGTVVHEFLHALAFHHEHQNVKGKCEDEFRWDDDAGYEPTTDSNGSYITDALGRRPGIYTYLAGPPNSWPRAKVDHNLRPTSGNGVSAGVFDPASIMLYRFPTLFYKHNPSPCAPTADAESLSGGDTQGLVHLYPFGEAAVASVDRQSAILSAMVGDAGSHGGLEGMAGVEQGPRSSPLVRAIVEVLQRNSDA